VSSGEFEGNRAVLAEANLDAPLAAREPLRSLEKDGDVFDSAHRDPSMSVGRVSIAGSRAGRHVLRT
jgi:hypothetical protein